MSYKIQSDIRYILDTFAVSLSDTPHSQSMNGDSNGQDSTGIAHLPDPWLFDSEALLRELARCRETALQIPVTNPNATHFGVQLTVNAIYNLEENLRYLL